MNMKKLKIILFGLLLPVFAMNTLALPDFETNGGKLLIRTRGIEIIFENGAIVNIKNMRTGENLSTADKNGNSKINEEFQKNSYHPQNGSLPEFKQVGKNKVELRYAEIAGGTAKGTLIYTFETNPSNERIYFTVTLEGSEVSDFQADLIIPVFNLSPKTDILGNGASYTRSDKSAKDWCIRWGNNFTAPRVVIAEGRNGDCIALWAESSFELHNIMLAHDRTRDDIFLYSADKKTVTATGYNKIQRTPDELKTVTWSIGAFSNWLSAAKVYREDFEKRTGIKPLWENSSSWVRNIHAVFTALPPGAGNGDDFFKKMSEIIDPSKLLLFYWNGSWIILFADHRYTDTGRPRPDEIKTLTKYGFHWIGYHPYTLIFAPQAVEPRFKKFEKFNWKIPENYKFIPAYNGTPEKFYEYFRLYAGGYYHDMDASDCELWVLHPGAKQTREYFMKNFSSYCLYYNMSGSYLDTFGGAGSRFFKKDKQIFENMTYCMGAAKMASEIKSSFPDLGMMSELQSEWILPYIFYTWEGSEYVNNPKVYKVTPTKLNHPLKTALWGSYTWRREKDIDVADSALLGTLPEMNLNDSWSIARAKLFTENELFNDLPEKWDDNALAYYRSKGNKWFQFRKTEFGDAYVELSENNMDFKIRMGRFRGMEKSSLSEPCRIPGWAAYDNESRPIGLNPDKTYNFLLEKPVDEYGFTITEISPGLYIDSIRDEGNWIVVEFDSKNNAIKEGSIKTTFTKEFQQICGFSENKQGSFLPGTSLEFKFPVAEGLVFVKKDTPAMDKRLRSIISQAKGKIFATGLKDNADWYNSSKYTSMFSLNKKEEITINIGPGHWRGYSEAWVEISSQGNPELKFVAGYFISDKKPSGLPDSLLFTVSVNGTPIWKKEIKDKDEWNSVSVPLKEFAGRKVLLTLSVQYAFPQDAVPYPHSNPGRWGNVRIDNNPDALEVPEKASVSVPAKILIRSPVNEEDLKTEWKTFISPDNKKGVISFSNGKIHFNSQHYKYCYIMRQFPEGATTIQAGLKTVTTGNMMLWNSGIGLFWDSKNYTFITGGICGKEESLCINGYGKRKIALNSGSMKIDEKNMAVFWVKISLMSEKIIYSYSLDGSEWKEALSLPREKEYLSSPQMFILGKGSSGTNEYYSNDAKYNGMYNDSFLCELFVGVN